MPNKPVTVQYYDTLDRINFVYPHYESPFRVSINPNYSKWMDGYCCQWAVNNSGPMRSNKTYVDSIQRSDLGFFSAVCFPTANWHRIEKLMKWCLMFFIVDDYHDIVTQMNKQDEKVSCDYFWQHMIDMLDCLAVKQWSSKAEWPDFIKGIQTVLSEMYFDYTDEQIRRSVRMIKDYIEGNVLETEWFDANNNHSISSNTTTTAINGKNGFGDKEDTAEIPDWDSYMKARLGSVGGQMSLQLIEYAKNVSLTDAEFNHPLMHSLERAVSEEMTLVNDFLTFRKEVAENDFKFSKMRHAFPVLVNQGLTLQESVNHVHELIQKKDNEILEILRLIQTDSKLNSSTQSTKRMSAYVDGVNEFVGGYWRHAVTARRYHGKSFQGTIPPEGHFLYDPQQTIIMSKTHGQHRYEWYTEVPENVQPM